MKKGKEKLHEGGKGLKNASFWGYKLQKSSRRGGGGSDEQR